MSIINHLKTLPQYFIPQHGLSQWLGKLADKQTSLTPSVIKWFAKRYQIDMSIAEQPDLEAYKTFNDFFTRAIRPETRPICNEPNTMASPVDGAISQLGTIEDGKLFQAKGHEYTAQELLGGDHNLAESFSGGQFCTIYLSPRDYHRFHMPIDGTLTSMLHVPGKLFSVNPLTAATVPNLFARNERVVAMFDTEWGPLAYVAVGATVVGSIEMIWDGIVTPPSRSDVKITEYTERSIKLLRGSEVGRFRLGSTVILLLPKGSYQWQKNLTPGASVKLGEKLIERSEEN